MVVMRVNKYQFISCIFPDVFLKTWTYFNSGFVLNKSHREFCDDIYNL